MDVGQKEVYRKKAAVRYSEIPSKNVRIQGAGEQTTDLPLGEKRKQTVNVV